MYMARLGPSCPPQLLSAVLPEQIDWSRKPMLLFPDFQQVGAIEMDKFSCAEDLDAHRQHL